MSVWEFKIDPRRLREETKNDIDAPQAIFGSKKRANEAQSRSKRIWRPALVDLEAPKSSQEPPKNPPRAPKRRPGEPQNAFKTSFGSKMMIFQKSSSRPITSAFLRVGGTVWEFKIHPKRLREEIKNDIEKRRKKKDKKRASRATRRASKNYDGLCPFKAEKETGAVWSPGAPRRAPRAPKMRPREHQNASKTIFGSKMMIFQISSSRRHKINFFEGGRLGLGG